MTATNDRSASSSIAEGLLATAVESADSFQMVVAEGREAEKERLRASQQRKAMLESLRSSVVRKESPDAELKERRAKVVRIIRDGAATAVDSEAKQILRMVKTIKHKGELSREAEKISRLFAEKSKAFTDKKTLLESIEKKIEGIKERTCSDSRGMPTSPAGHAAGIEKILFFARSLGADLARMMDDLISVYERLEAQLETDTREDENVQRFFYGCISSVDDKVKSQIISKCRAACLNASVEKKRAVYRTVVENLARTQVSVAKRIHQLARKKAREFLVQNRPDDAVSELCSALRLWRDDSDSYKILSNALEKKGDAHGAMVALQEVVRLQPDDLLFRMRAARRLEDFGWDEQAIQHYEEIVARSLPDLKIVRRLAAILFKKKKYQRLIELLEKYSQQFTDDAECQYWLGASWHQLGQPRKAIPFLRKGIGAIKSRDDATHFLVLAYRDIGMIDESAEIHRKHVKLIGDCPRAHIVQGLLAQARGDLKETINEFHKAIDKHGESYNLLLSMGRAQIEAGQLTEAAQILRKAVEADAMCCDAFVELGKAYRLSQEYGQAEEVLKRAVELNRDDEAARYELSMVYLETGEWKLAREIL